MTRSLALIWLAALSAACRASSPVPPSAVASRSASEPKRLVGQYEVAYDGRAELRVEARLSEPTPKLTIESGAEPFIDAIEARADDPNAPWQPVARDGRIFTATACAGAFSESSTHACQLRYRVRLREAARAIDDMDSATEEGDAIEATPSTWLVAPDRAEGGLLRFHVTTTRDTTFRSGVHRVGADTWEIAVADLWTSPYSIFGPLRVTTFPIPDDATAPGIELAIAPGALAVTDAELSAWATRATAAVASYFGRFPMRELLVIVVPSQGRWIGMGKTLSGGGSSILVRVGERAPARALERDWVLVHEMVHLTLPAVPEGHHWAEEGLATYVEPFVRSRAGLVRAEEAWAGLLEGLPNGLPRPGDLGLDHTPTWGRTYWGGALFYLLADVEIRKRTLGAKGLDDALQGILARGGKNTERWSLEDVFTAGDAALGMPVLTELHQAMASSAHPVDLAALWAELGVSRAGRAVVFDDAAPLAAIRRAIDGTQRRASIR